ncbi:hypothetical protein ACFUJU_13710 [Streptomyces sp. NPDC057235]|uniref:hypothetical protein n=1 Tax=Streptomyces sp. NPDC057235 TaxID=3346058 RepID=UPI0036340943
MTTLTQLPEQRRRDWLLAEIRQRGGVWTAIRAEEALHRSAWPTSGRNTARKDLKALAARGALTVRDDVETHRRSYTPKVLVGRVLAGLCPECRLIFEGCTCGGTR